MSIFSELLPKINEISNTFTKHLNDDLKVVLECFDNFEEEFQNGRRRAREKPQKDKNAITALQSINEDDGEPKKPDNETKLQSSDKSSESSTERRASKKRSKNEVEGILSPEQDKRQKRNASVKAQGIITKQVNTNLTQKLRRENSDKVDKNASQSSRSRRRKDDEKENIEPNIESNIIVPVVQIKEEKISLPPEPMDMSEIEVKREVNKDEIAMPPPVAPVPKPRKAVAKDKPEESSEDESSGKRRTTRTRKQTESIPPPPVPAARPMRSSSRARLTDSASETEQAPPPEPRPKRTRAKKKVSESTSEPEKDSSQASQEIVPVSPAEKPRPKRTRRAQKAAEKEEPPKPVDPEPTQISPKEDHISKPEIHSPILPQKELKPPKKGKTNPPESNSKLAESIKDKIDPISNDIESKGEIEVDSVDNAMDETKIIGKVESEKTMVIPNGVYNQAALPKNRNMNETVVIERCDRETMVLDKPQTIIMDCTVVIEKGLKVTNITDDNSLLTDDSDFQDAQTPSKQQIPNNQPTSAVKAKVQQFEELATRVTRTKTRAMAKQEGENTDNQTPPDKISKAVLSSETLAKMNSLIFNGKQPQISSSASKPRSAIPAPKQLPASASKVSAIGRAKEAAEESLKREDARKKKEALLEAKRELQKRKREEKTAAAAAAREAADKERQAALAAAAKDRMEKQAHADKGKIERLKEIERKKQELARKVAETEERRKAEETARHQRLADEQRRALAQRQKQIEEQEAMKREAAMAAREIEQKQREYIEKQKKQQRLEDKSHTPFRTPGTPKYHTHPMEPVYMQDGFQYLNSDEDEEPMERPIPEWSTFKARKQQLSIQSQISQVHVDRLFAVRVHSPDLRDIFPNIERNRLKRTSSAVWRTPPHLPPVTE